MDTRPLISVVDDDESVRESLPDLVRELGFEARAFKSAEAFLESDTAERTQCLILDLMMPGMDGRSLACELKARGMVIPIIFITANNSLAARSRMLDDNTIACLYKPFSEAELSSALVLAVRKHNRH